MSDSVVENKIGEIQMVDISTLKIHPKNPNKHPADQIDKLANILKYQGWRYPIKVSSRSGFITAGHGRLLAAKKLGLKTVPVSFQHYDSDEQEFADIVSDNAIAGWADLDLEMINLEVSNMDLSFDTDLFGLQIELGDESETSPPSGAIIKPEFIISIFCKNETELQSLYEEMKNRGHECKLIT